MKLFRSQQYVREYLKICFECALISCSADDCDLEMILAAGISIVEPKTKNVLWEKDTHL